MYDHKDGISLRKVEETDLQSLLELKQRNWWGTHKSPIINSIDQKKWFESIPDNQLFLLGTRATATSNTPTSIGVAVYTDIDWISRTLQISGSVFKNVRSDSSKDAFCAGLDFAFEMLNMQKCEAEVLDYHIPAKKLEIDILGFKVEGVKRKSVYKCGKYYDSLVIGLLREEWESSERVKEYGDSCNHNFSHDSVEAMLSRFGSH
jgi:RimJ/RimL family protein N-acetyltransferase